MLTLVLLHFLRVNVQMQLLDKQKNYACLQTVKHLIQLPFKNENSYKMNEGHYYFDDGTEFNPDLYPKPSLCLMCKKEGDPNEEILCNLTRMDQHGESDFICHAHEKK